MFFPSCGDPCRSHWCFSCVSLVLSYWANLKLWFKQKISKEEFDLEARRLLAQDNGKVTRVVCRARADLTDCSWRSCVSLLSPCSQWLPAGHPHALPDHRLHLRYCSVTAQRLPIRCLLCLMKVCVCVCAEGAGSLQWTGGSASKPGKPSRGKKKFPSVRQKFDVSSVCSLVHTYTFHLVKGSDIVHKGVEPSWYEFILIFTLIFAWT